MPTPSTHPCAHTRPAGARARLRAERARRDDIRRVVRQLIRQYRAVADSPERRRQSRVDFLQPVRVVTQDRGTFTLLTRDLSADGIRLIGTRRLLGQRVHVLIPAAEGSPPWDFLVRIIWTCAVGGDLIENGGTFLGVSPGGPPGEG